MIALKKQMLLILLSFFAWGTQDQHKLHDSADEVERQVQRLIYEAPDGVDKMILSEGFFGQILTHNLVRCFTVRPKVFALTQIVLEKTSGNHLAKLDDYDVVLVEFFAQEQANLGFEVNDDSFAPELARLIRLHFGPKKILIRFNTNPEDKAVVSGVKSHEFLVKKIFEERIK